MSKRKFVKSLVELKKLITNDKKDFQLHLNGGAYTTRTIWLEDDKIKVDFDGSMLVCPNWRYFAKAEPFFLSGILKGAVSYELQPCCR